MEEVKDHNSSRSFEKIDHPKHREFIEMQNNCLLCGTALELKYLRSEEQRQIREEAFCTQCELKTRAKIFSLN